MNSDCRQTIHEVKIHCTHTRTHTKKNNTIMVLLILKKDILIRFHVKILHF